MKKKLIYVALTLAEINDASAYDKMPGIGPHPKGIHQAKRVTGEKGQIA